jgi:hypothetical protein
MWFRRGLLLMLSPDSWAMLPAVRQKLHLSPCAVTDDDVAERNPKTVMLDLVQPLAA